MRHFIEQIKNLTFQKSSNHTVISRLFQNVNDELLFTSDVHEILRDISTNELCFLIFNMGNLARYSQVNIKAATLNRLFSEIILSSKLNTKMLTQCLYGAGKLAEAGRLQDSLAQQHIQALVAQLTTSHPNPQDIANTIWGLGKLIEYRLLNLDILELPISGFMAQMNVDVLSNIELGQIIYGFSQ